ncbi:MAG: hypothetical protein M3Q80_02255 [bacterium]|nr:hypothetical protein [bacterium]
MNFRSKTSSGFIASTAIILLASGTLVFSLTTLGAVILYADSIDRAEMRMQKNLNQIACKDTQRLIQAKDYFVTGDVFVHEFDCILHL